MIPLLLAGLLALTVIFERGWMLTKVYVIPAPAIRNFFDALSHKQLDEAQRLCQTLPHFIRPIFITGLQHLQHAVGEFEFALKNQAEAQLFQLEERLSLLDTVITAAPLMGLLGTITGMMSSFEVLSEKGIQDSSAITGGVAEALIATATGLVIALLTLMAYNFLTQAIKQKTHQIETLASDLIALKIAHDRKSATAALH